MATKINSKTSLKQIKSYAMNDFGVKITNGQAKEIREAVRRGCAVWSGASYVSTVNGDDIVRISNGGVQYTAYRTFYSTKEWNEAIDAGRFS